MSAEERLMIAMVLLGGIGGYRSNDLSDLRRLGLAAIRHLTLAVEAIR